MMPAPLPAPTHRERIPPLLPLVAEFVVVMAVFAAAGCWPVPDTNEPHYLPKARHFQNPRWCAGDFFLESTEAHPLFYRVMGPVTTVLTLEQAAWVGRWAGWFALAAGIEWLLTSVVDTRRRFSPWRILAAAIWSLGTRHAAASGEWVIGGCEAKVFAWAFVLGAAGMMSRGRPALAWLLSGLGAAIHPLVGGWSMVACGLAATASWALGHRGMDRDRRRRAPVWLEAASILGGMAAAAIGVVPGLRLSAGVGAAEAAEAVRTYVVDRFAHHLLVTSFADGMVARHVLAVMLCLVVLMLVRRTPELDRLAGFVAAAVAIAVGGCVIPLLDGPAPDLALRLLRFYWFRLSDGLVPLLLAAAGTLLAKQTAGSWSTIDRRLRMPAALCMGIVAVLLAVDLANESRHWPLPGRPEVACRADRHVQPAAWEDVCRWVRETTPTTARFLTPRGSASFQWRAERPEVVAWKHSPQNFGDILAWRRRLLDCFAVGSKGSLRSLERSTAVFGPERVHEVAERYEADFMIVPVDPTGNREAMPFDKVYANAGYEVYRVRKGPE